MESGRYKVNQREYTGRSGRNWRDPRYSQVQVDEKSAVYFSASHPWLSLLYKPDAILEGAPVILIALVLEFLVILTIVNPKS
jgi:hypothetical protein